MPQHQRDAALAIPNGLDHLVYASSTLERGIDEIEALLGVRPVRCGHHPRYGTHNAQLALGDGVYLEIIARDPELPAPPRGALIDLPSNADSRLLTWVYRTADIEAAASAAGDAAVGLGPVESGSRVRPDGSEIRWQMTDPYAMPMAGAIPFLINWGAMTHPSAVVPSAGQFVELEIRHPEPDRVRDALSVLGAEARVIAGETCRLAAKIRTSAGLTILE